MSLMPVPFESAQGTKKLYLGPKHVNAPLLETCTERSPSVTRNQLPLNRLLQLPLQGPSVHTQLCRRFRHVEIIVA